MPDLGFYLRDTAFSLHTQKTLLDLLSLSSLSSTGMANFASPSIFLGIVTIVRGVLVYGDSSCQWWVITSVFQWNMATLVFLIWQVAWS